MSLMAALAIRLATWSEWRVPLFIAGWTATCLLELPLLRHLWPIVRQGSFYRRGFAFTLAYPVCCAPVVVWAYVAINLLIGLADSRYDPPFEADNYIALLPFWAYSVAAIIVSFWRRVGGSREQSFLRLRILAIYNLIIPALLLLS